MIGVSRRQSWRRKGAEEESQVSLLPVRVPHQPEPVRLPYAAGRGAGGGRAGGARGRRSASPPCRRRATRRRCWPSRSVSSRLRGGWRRWTSGWRGTWTRRPAGASAASGCATSAWRPPPSAWPWRRPWRRRSAALASRPRSPSGGGSGKGAPAPL